MTRATSHVAFSPNRRDVARAELATRNFYRFCEFVHNVKLARHMRPWVEALLSEDRRLRTTAIAAPPEFWKSRVIRMFIEWDIGVHPEWARILIMNAAAQAWIQVQSVQDTLEHNPRYQLTFPHVEPDKDRGWNRDTLYIKRKNSARPDPTLKGCGVHGPIQGIHAERIFCDDVTDQQDPRSDSTMAAQREWIRGLVHDRLMRDPEGVPIGSWFAILTRWGDSDLWQTFTSPDPEIGMNFHAIQMPALNEANPYPWGDELWPEEFPRARLAKIRAAKTHHLYTMTYLCDPTATGGLVFQRAKWGRFDLHDPPDFRYILHTWDLASGASDAASFSVMQEWSVGATGYYLTYAWRSKAPLSEVEAEIVNLYDLRPGVNRVLIEDRAAGTSAIRNLESDDSFLPIEALQPKGDKLDRAERHTGLLDRGSLFVPSGRNAPDWVEPFLAELTSFPRGQFDDQVDAMSQALEFLRGGHYFRGRGRQQSWMGKADRRPVPELVG
jgi:predicted phage terminase large subunit-like protein